MKTRWHYLALIVLACAVGVLFLQEPGFGDDFTYWSFGLELHERGFKAWDVSSFHQLRWPVWGICWLLQAIVGIGIAAYYGEPLIYLSLGAIVAFVFGRRLAESFKSPAFSPLLIGWLAAIAFLFHPLLDSVAYRPMPDLSEAVWGGVAILAWWALMRAASTGPALLWALLTGLVIYVLESNRLTGVFIVPVLLIATLWLYPRRFGWLVVAGVFAAAFYVAECAFYHWMFQDWLHNLHANLGGKDRKGTESIALWYLPFRFFDALWKGTILAPIYCLLAIYGGWNAWRRGGAVGRLLVLWFGVLYMEYSCAPQSLWPYRPLIRDADRFLCGLVIPFSTLAAIGLGVLCQLPKLQTWPSTRWLLNRPVAAAIVGAIFLVCASGRELFDLGFVPKMRRYMSALPEGTRIFSHRAMRDMAFLVNAKAASHFKWNSPPAILHRTPWLEKVASESDEFWYARKLVWLTTRKKLEHQTMADQPTLGSYFETPERDWVLAQLLAKGDTPDLIFYRHRHTNSPPAAIFDATAPMFQGVFPALPVTWERKVNPATVTSKWTIPADWKGKLGRFEIEAASEQVEALTIDLKFVSNGERKTQAAYLLKPYFYPNVGKEFFALPIPADSEECLVIIKFAKSTKRVVLKNFRAIIEPSSDPAPR